MSSDEALRARLAKACAKRNPPPPVDTPKTCIRCSGPLNGASLWDGTPAGPSLDGPYCDFCEGESWGIYRRSKA